MGDPDILVIGGGPAGMSAALEAARSGLTVELIEQRESLGGAIYRQPVEGVPAIPQSAGARSRWEALSRAFGSAAIPVRFGSVFLGIDGHGCVLVEDCCGTTSPPFCTEAAVWQVENIYGFVSDSRNILSALKGA